MIRLHRIDHVRLRVTDLGEAVPRWCEQFGLMLRSQEDGVARLACDDEPYCLGLSTVGEGGGGGGSHTAWSCRRSARACAASSTRAMSCTASARWQTRARISRNWAWTS